jgi:hypothetical protein
MSGLVRGRPGRRIFEPSYFVATSLRYQRSMVSAVTMRRNGREVAPAQGLAFHGQLAPLVVGEARRSGAMRRTKDTILLKQSIDRLASSSSSRAIETHAMRRRVRAIIGRPPHVVDYSAACAASASTAATLGNKSWGTPCRSCKYAGLL